MAHLSLTLRASKRWWFDLALAAAVVALWAGLIRDADSEEHLRGRVTGTERAAKWLVDHGIGIDIS